MKTAADKEESHGMELLDKTRGFGYICEPYLSGDDKSLEWNHNWSLYQQLIAFEPVLESSCYDKVQNEYEFGGCGVPDYDEEQKYIDQKQKEICCQEPLSYYDLKVDEDGAYIVVDNEDDNDESVDNNEKISDDRDDSKDEDVDAL